MNEWLTNWSTNPTIIIALIAVISLIWQGGRWTGRIEEGLKSLSEQIDTGLKNLREEMRDQHAETRRALDTLLLRAGGTPATARSSPLKITEFGRKVEATLEPTKWIAASTEKLRRQADGLEPFEVDALCQHHVETSLDTDWQRRVSRTAYELGIDNRAVEDVLRVLLRDALLAKATTAAPDAPPEAPTAT